MFVRDNFAIVENKLDTINSSIVSSAGSSNVNLNAINTHTVQEGNGVSGNGVLRVAVCSNNSTIPVSISGNQAVNITQVKGVAISTGQSTVDSGCIRVSCALGASGIGAPVEISGFGGISTTPGAKASSLCFPVVLPTDCATIPVSISGNQAVNVTQLGGNAISTGGGNTTSGTIRNYVADDCTVGTSLNELRGTTLAINDGVVDNGTQRVILANNIFAPMNIGRVNNGTTFSFGTGPVGLSTLRTTLVTDVNVPVNNAQINGVAFATNTGVSSTGCQRVTLSRESIEKYNISRSFQSSVTQQIRSRFQPTSSATFFKPVGFDAGTSIANLADGDTNPKQLFISSTSALDTMAVRIVGYNTTGAMVEEGLFLNGTTAVQTVNSYSGIRSFFIRNANSANAGIVSISDLNTSPPARAMAQIAVSAGIQRAYINWIQPPPNAPCWLTELTVCKTGGTLSHTLILCEKMATTGLNTQIGSSTRREVQRWGINGNDTYTFDGFRIDPSNGASGNYVLWMEALGSGVDATADVSISATFVFG
jgi:hypothetical protein